MGLFFVAHGTADSRGLRSDKRADTSRDAETGMNTDMRTGVRSRGTGYYEANSGTGVHERELALEAGICWIFSPAGCLGSNVR